MKPLTFFWPFGSLPERFHPIALREFAEAGADAIVLDDGILSEMLAKPASVSRWRGWLADAGMRFRDAHGVYGAPKGADLNEPDAAAARHMVAMHRAEIALCAELDVRSITIHVGNTRENARDVEALHANLLRSLEAILPDAEAAGVTVCIENTWWPTTTAARLLDAIRRFPTPALGVCWDSGHAWLSRRDTPSGEFRKFHEACGLEPDWQEGALEALLPHIVTCHLHGNDGERDRHWLPTDPRGRTDWAREMPLLLSAPRLLQLQNEASPSMVSPFTPRQSVESLRAIAALG